MWESRDNDRPLHIILRLRGLDSLEGQVSGERPTNQIGNRGGKCINENHYNKLDRTSLIYVKANLLTEHDQRRGAENTIRLGDLGALLQVAKGGVLAKLIAK